MSIFHIRRCWVGLCWLIVVADSYGQTQPELASTQLQLEQQRERARAEQAAASLPDVRLPRPALSDWRAYPERESPCFPIQKITLAGDDAARFHWSLAAVDDARGRCLGSEGINAVLVRVQNALISAGYVTTRVVAAPQDLRAGALTLVLVPGRVRALRFAAPDAVADHASPGPASPPTHYWNTLPTGPGELLNLRDIEQGLENFKRVPTAEADIQIVPGSAPGDSDLLIQWRQSQRVRLSLSVDDGGSDATGKYQGSATVSLDNPFGLQDLFYFSLSNDLNGNGPVGRRGTSGHGLFYSLPFGYWLLALSGSDFDYRQSIAGASQNYVYSGSSRNIELKLSRVLYRNGVRKVGGFVRGYQRNSKNFIDDTEIEVQRRKMGGFALGLTDKEFIGNATLDTSLAYQRGTGAFGTLAAPEEAFGEGTSRPHIITADVGLALPFTAFGNRFDYQGSLHGQWNRSTLIAQDRFAIGGRYTVRGFDGDSSLSAERGWLSRNELGWSPVGTRQQLYVGVDYAQLGGPSAALLLGTRLGGAVLGWRGQWLGLQYDVFAGKPIIKPQRFRTAAVASGFSINYQF